MEEANNLINILLSNGGTVTMAVLFIVFLYLDRKDRKDKERKTYCIRISNTNSPSSSNYIVNIISFYFIINIISY